MVLADAERTAAVRLQHCRGAGFLHPCNVPFRQVLGSPKSRKTFWGEEAQRNERAFALTWKRAIWSLCRRFGGVQGGIFKGRPCRGVDAHPPAGGRFGGQPPLAAALRPEMATGQRPILPRRAHGTLRPFGRKCNSGLLHFRRKCPVPRRTQFQRKEQ